MSSPEDKERRKSIRHKNLYAKILFDPNEFKGAFSTKVINDKTSYRRKEKHKKDYTIPDDEE